MAKPRFPLSELTANEREQLQQWTRRSTSAQALALRARIILRLAEGPNRVEVAEHFHVHLQTVGNGESVFASAASMVCWMNLALGSRAQLPIATLKP